jgi:hypothetical protein
MDQYISHLYNSNRAYDLVSAEVLENILIEALKKLVRLNKMYMQFIL